MDSVGDRMKANYEQRFHPHLMRRTPVILRLDGRSFHSVTRDCIKPFDGSLLDCMVKSAIAVCKEAQGAKLAYIQSDEISVLMTDFDLLTTQAWFDYDQQKVVSISASIASVEFTQSFLRSAQFDCRAFNIPKEEAANYFVWRQKDWIRNSVQMLARAHFSHNALNNKSQEDMHQMLHEKGVHWGDLEGKWKNGTIITNGENGWVVREAPIFTQDREVIERYLKEV